MQIKDEKGNVIGEVTGAKPNESTCREGIWLTLHSADGSRPTLCLVNSDQQFYLGFYKDAVKPSSSCDFALSFGDNGPMIQVSKNDGKEIRFIDLFELAKHLETSLPNQKIG